MNTKSYILPLEKIRQTTPYGDLESGVIPQDPYDGDCHKDALRKGRILLLKTSTEVFIIGYLPQGWQITIGDDNTLRAHGPSEKHPYLHILEGNLKEKKPIDPWEECPQENPYLPWCISYLVHPATGEIRGKPPEPLWNAPLITPHPNHILLPQQKNFKAIPIDPKTLAPFNPEQDLLTTHQTQNQTLLRAVKLQKTWQWEK
jgi:hypothetical protein